MFIELTSAVSGQKFFHLSTDIIGIERWSPALSGHSVMDPTDSIPPNTQSMIRVTCGLVMPLEETPAQVLELLGEKVS